ncbi:MAG: 50S ribosomal protein L25 [Deltaproteobacteria bacterium]|nr:50S ribosomal protein L25 [Deltaproteobacteria bacterium]
MEHVTLKATARTELGKSPNRRLRSSGQIPSVAYGKGTSQPLSLAVDHDALLGVLGSPKGRNSVIYLAVEGDKSYPVMVRDFAVHPISRRLLHADFITVDENAPIDVEVPFVTHGKSKGEADGGTVLVGVRRLPVRCLPAAIPAKITVDVTPLGMEEGIKVKELGVPAGVEVLLPAERRIVIVKAPKSVEEKGAAEGAAGDAKAADAKKGADAKKPDAKKPEAKK